MPPPVTAAVFTGVWLAAFLVLIRWWELTARVPGLMLWTLIFLVIFVALARAVHGPAVRERQGDVWRPAAAWVGLIMAALLIHALVPTLRIGRAHLQMGTMIGVLDLAVPVWIMLRGLLQLWRGIPRVAVVAALPILLFLGTWMFVVRMPGQSWQGDLPPLTESERSVRDEIERHVNVLALQIGERNANRYDGLLAAERYLDSTLTALGYAVARQEFSVVGLSFRNLEVTIAGGRDSHEIVVVGAHYDTAWDTPGADDNASGVAVLLTLAGLMAGDRPERTVRLVWFANEEPPFFDTDRMGSRHYAARSRERGEQIVAMISLETIGYYTTEPGSQRYPFPFSLFYPDRGDFIGFVGNLRSADLVRRAIAIFRETMPFPSEGVASPGWIPGITWSDHASFWLSGYPAIMITNTAPFRNPHYHLPGDIPETLDYDRTARVAGGIAAVVRALAGSSPPHESAPRTTLHNR